MREAGTLTVYGRVCDLNNGSNALTRLHTAHHQVMSALGRPELYARWIIRNRDVKGNEGTFEFTVPVLTDKE